MNSTRRGFLQAAAFSAASAAAAGADTPVLVSAEIARRHRIVRDLPTPNFFEGMLLGNGDLGVCVVVRPDALGLHLGKNDIWDIRVSEDHAAHVKPFAEVLKMWDRASERAKAAGKPDAMYLETSDPELREYTKLVTSSYSKPYPRPWPCGTVWFRWDPRTVRVVRQELDISSGLYTLDLGSFSIRVFVSRTEHHVCVWSDQPAPVFSVAWYPHLERTAPLPPPEVETSDGGFSGYQYLPARDDGKPSPADRDFALAAALTGTWQPMPQSGGPRAGVEHVGTPGPLRFDLVLLSSSDNDNPQGRARAMVYLEDRTRKAAGDLSEASAAEWRKWWSRSAVQIDDSELERIWYHNQYWLACCLKNGAVAPGLFGNWSAPGIGTAWHGDYHMNYNTQQVWWGVLSSNHADQDFPYLNLVEMLAPMAERNAKDQFGLSGLYFPHSAYPVPSNVNPYPAPPWGYEICETPWTVQQLWWHYLYTRDEQFLARAYPLMRGAADFLMAYVRKGPNGKYNIQPSVSPENWGLTVDGRLNRNCIIDIALTQFLLDAIVEASRVLNRDHELRGRWAEVGRNLAKYPEVDSPAGRVWLDIENAPAEWIYNVPVTASPVFPGEQVGLDRHREMLDIARRTVANIDRKSVV